MNNDIYKEIWMCFAASLKNKFFIQFADRKNSKKRNARDANNIFRNPVLLYLDIDNEDSKIDRTVVPPISTISA